MNLFKNDVFQQKDYEESMNNKEDKSTQVSYDHFPNLSTTTTTAAAAASINNHQRNLMKNNHNKNDIDQTKTKKTINDFRFESCRNVITSTRKLSMNDIERRCHDFLESSSNPFISYYF